MEARQASCPAFPAGLAILDRMSLAGLSPHTGRENGGPERYDGQTSTLRLGTLSFASCHPVSMHWDWRERGAMINPRNKSRSHPQAANTFEKGNLRVKHSASAPSSRAPPPGQGRWAGGSGHDRSQQGEGPLDLDLTCVLIVAVALNDFTVTTEQFHAGWSHCRGPRGPAEAGDVYSRSQHAGKWLPHQEACKPSVETRAGCAWGAGRAQLLLCAL